MHNICKISTDVNLMRKIFAIKRSFTLTHKVIYFTSNAELVIVTLIAILRSRTITRLDRTSVPQNETDV